MNAYAAPNVTQLDVLSRNYKQLSTYFDSKYATVWCRMHPTPRQCFTPQLLSDLNEWFGLLGKHARRHGIRYHVLTSDDPQAFNLGGDVELFRQAAQAGDRARLMEYARACIDALYSNLTHFHQDVTTIALVRGSALGGGFEAALSCDIIIAERGARLGFPEVLFNLFPGMGAYSFLSRKIGPQQAQRIILSGKLYDAEELHDMGLIDVLVEPGAGEQAVYAYIKREERASNAFRAMRKVRDYCSPVSRQELDDIVELWVDTAMQLTERDLRMMQRLVQRQSLLPAAAAEAVC